MECSSAISVSNVVAITHQAALFDKFTVAAPCSPFGRNAAGAKHPEPTGSFADESRMDACLPGSGHRLILDIDRFDAMLGDAKRYGAVFVIALPGRERVPRRPKGHGGAVVMAQATPHQPSGRRDAKRYRPERRRRA